MNALSVLRVLCRGWVAFGLAAVLLWSVPSSAQSKPSDDPFFIKLGAGLSDYTGDRPSRNTGYPFDLQGLARSIDGTRAGAPFAIDGEVGYQLSPGWAVAGGLQIGSYPILSNGTSFSSSVRPTAYVLGRYAFSPPGGAPEPGGTSSGSPSFYLDLGANVTLGGESAGYGPSIGAGIDVPINGTVSAFVESRFNFTLPDDAIDGTGGLPRSTGSITGPLDSANKLLGAGLKVSFNLESGGDTPGGPAVSASGSAEMRSGKGPSSRRSSNGRLSGGRGTGERPAPDTSRRGESIQVPSGTFIMGLFDEDPLSLQNAGRKRVTVSSFYIDQHEVTNAEYRKYLNQLSPEARRERLPDSTVWANARLQSNWDVYFRGDYYSDHPVLGVTWEEAQGYCQAQDKRLPTEAEWEYAARGGHIGRIYPWEGLSARGSSGEYLANFNPPEGYTADGHAFTAPVGAYPPNDWGLHNMSGNVAEWTLDTYTSSYDNISDFNPRFQDENEPRRVVRGGSWNSDSFLIGVGARDTQPGKEASVSVGFRCVQDVGVSGREDSGPPPEPQDGGTQNGGTQDGGTQDERQSEDQS